MPVASKRTELCCAERDDKNDWQQIVQTAVALFYCSYERSKSLT